MPSGHRSERPSFGEAHNVYFPEFDFHIYVSNKIPCGTQRQIPLSAIALEAMTDDFQVAF